MGSGWGVSKGRERRRERRTKNHTRLNNTGTRYHNSTSINTYTFIYGYMASDISLRTILRVRKETRCRHIGYSYRLTARVLLYAPSHRQDNTYHGLCYTSRGALAGTRNSSMGPPHEGSIRRPIAPLANARVSKVSEKNFTNLFSFYKLVFMLWCPFYLDHPPPPPSSEKLDPPWMPVCI